MKNDQSEVLTLLVDNEFGVLTRVTALIRREGLNIRSLAVAETDRPDVSRLTISLYRRHGSMEHLIGRLKRQTSVREVTVFSPINQVAQELCIVRLDGGDPAAVESLCSRWCASRLGQEDGDVILSFCCAPEETGQLLADCRAIGLRDVSRSGVITLKKGNEGGDGNGE